MQGVDQSIREPVVAGMFYPERPAECDRAMGELFDHLPPRTENRRWRGALLPHAGWICSGAVAAAGLAALRDANSTPDVVVVFGAVHTIGGIGYGALDDHQQWRLPTGLVRLSDSARVSVLKPDAHIRVDARIHRREHAVEVLIPLIQRTWPGVEILPIEVPPIPQAVQIGTQTAKSLAADGLRAIFIASSDLTHYGPNYGLTPAGIGEEALRWAEKNDLRLLKLISGLHAAEIVSETEEHQNACGGGAIAAMIAACIQAGATRCLLLEHTNSHQVLSRRFGRQPPDNFVGYAAAVFS